MPRNAVEFHCFRQGKASDDNKTVMTTTQQPQPPLIRILAVVSLLAVVSGVVDAFEYGNLRAHYTDTDEVCQNAEFQSSLTSSTFITYV